MEFFRQLYRGTLAAWRQLSLSARINVAVAAVAVAAVIALLAFFSATPQYVTLSGDLDPADVTKIRTLLDERSIPYRLTDNNQTIQVPLSDRSEMQLVLAENDLPVGRSRGPGFELFAESRLMTSQGMQDINYLRAVQGELQRQLNAFDFVDYSLVLIREARDELFRDEERPSEATVTLATNRSLTKREKKGLVSMIARAGGANLQPTNITVSTTSGEFLHLPSETPFSAAANDWLEYQTAIEGQREQKVLAVLADMGRRGTVTVSARLDSDAKTTTTEELGEAVERDTYTQSTTITDRQRLPEGAPGAFANVPDASPENAETKEETKEEITNLDIPRTVTETRSDPGDVIKYSVALFVEGDYETGSDGEQSYIGLTEEQRQAFTDLAKAAVGEGETATEVKVHDHPFEIGQLPAATAMLEDMQASQWRTDLLGYVQSAIYILLIVVGFFVIRMLLHRAIEMPSDDVDQGPVAELPEASREDMRRQEVASTVRGLANKEPEAVAAILRSWMTEEED